MADNSNMRNNNTGALHDNDRDANNDYGWVDGNDVNDPGVVGRAGGRATTEDTSDRGAANLQEDAQSDEMGIAQDDVEDIDVI